jgi:hypothetical protein
VGNSRVLLVSISQRRKGDIKAFIYALSSASVREGGGHHSIQNPIKSASVREEEVTSEHSLFCLVSIHHIMREDDTPLIILLIQHQPEKEGTSEQPLVQ